MNPLRLSVVSLRYSSWSMRPWLALRHAEADFVTETADIELGKRAPIDAQDAMEEKSGEALAARRKLGSVTGLFPVLSANGVDIHESLAICEWANDAFPQAKLWPEQALDRARARAVSCEMLSGFANIRTHLSCHLFGRTKEPLALDAATLLEVLRVFEIWKDALARSGGPYLFGRFSIADCMYYPMRTRFRSYGVAIPRELDSYVETLDATPAVRALEEVARKAPRGECQSSCRVC
jgi:glutathione S-transferase